MKIPFSWLADFVDLSAHTPFALAETVSLKAFEVEEVESVGTQIQGPLTSGKILEIQKHPNADKLQVTKVLLAENAEAKQIVCGAKNIQVGQIVPVALPGAVVLNRTNGEALPIKVGKIRDVESCGMLCSAAELGIDADGEGIHILDSNWPVGLDLLDKLNLKPSYVMHVASRSNRGDAMSLQGIAREVAATIKQDLKLDYYKKEYHHKFAELKSKLTNFKSTIDTQDCHKIGFFQIGGIKITESPDWIKERLKLAGVSSINNVVDVTNYVMLEIGQPMHAYDAAKLDLSAGLKVSLGKKEEKFLALDDNEYNLSDFDYLTINDSKNVVSLAGVIGGKESSINESTQSIVLEAACFAPWAVRRSSRKSGVSTESSRRFERGTDPALIEIALLRAAELIKQLAGGKIESVSFSESSVKAVPPTIQLELAEYERVIGASIDGQVAKNILATLGFKVDVKSPEQILVNVPSYRADDVIRPIDVIEELARFTGLNEVESQALPGVEKFLAADNALQKLKDKFVGQGYFECISSSLLPESPENINAFLPDQKSVKMLNPLSSEHAELRTSLIPGLLKALAVNLKRQKTLVKLFEVGKIYASPESWISSSNEERETKTQEKLVVSAICSSKGKTTNWQSLQSSNTDFYELKGILEAILERKGRLEFLPLPEGLTYAFLHPRVGALLKLNGQIVGYCGKVHPRLCKHWEITDNTFVFELLAEAALKEGKFKYKSLNDNPLITRDFTIDLPQDTDLTHEFIEKKVALSKLSNLKELKLLSLYKPKEGNNFSLSYRLVFQGEKQNLLGDEVNAEMGKLKKNLQEQLSGASFRDV